MGRYISKKGINIYSYLEEEFIQLFFMTKDPFSLSAGRISLKSNEAKKYKQTSWEWCRGQN